MCYRCSEPNCNQILRTYYQGNTLVGECENPDCRLYTVTLTPEELASLTEQQREGWYTINQKHREMDEQRQREMETVLSRLPAHLRKPMG